MGKIVDITGKLSFGENPKIAIKKEKYEVNADATTVLEIMGLLSSGGDEVAGMIKAYEKLFSEADRNKIAALKLPFKDLIVIIQQAMSLVMGEEEPGEQ